jgi:hypothetical protein
MAAKACPARPGQGGVKACHFDSNAAILFCKAQPRGSRALKQEAGDGRDILPAVHAFP